MSERAPVPMTADEFIDWAMSAPEGEHYELDDGEVVAMSPKRFSHGLTKGLIYRRLAERVEAASLPCDVFTDSMAVKIDNHIVFEPDVVLRCGPRPPDDPVKLLDPLLVVEVVSASSRGIDTGRKLHAYFTVASLRHYLVVDARARRVIHYWRDTDGGVQSRISGEEAIRLDPPGIVLADFFPSL